MLLLKVIEMCKCYTIDNATSISYGYEPTAFTDPENGFKKHASNVIASDSIRAINVGIFMPCLSNLLRLRYLSKP